MTGRQPVTGRIPLFVCGEPARGDDAAGHAAVELLSPAIRWRVDVVVAGQLDVLFLMDLPADVPCVVVDAVAGLRPGEIWVRPLAALVDRARALADDGRGPEPRSSHELPLEQVLALAATLRDAPPAGTFVGIGGTCWDVGTPLTLPVAQALPAYAAAIEAAIEELGGAAIEIHCEAEPEAAAPWAPEAPAEGAPDAPGEAASCEAAAP